VGLITGDRTVEIEASIDDCFEIAADIEGAPKWQGSMKKAKVLERDAEGRPELVETENDAKVKTVKSLLRFSYDKPHRIEWVQEKGDTKAVRGWWNLEDLGSEGTRATYALEVDPGRMLGMLMRGPVEGQVRDFLLGNAAAGLKEEAEGAR
jgi:Polyketide cyclase / dehydrase and lipid transport